MLDLKITTQKHSKTGKDVWIVKVQNRLPKSEFSRLFSFATKNKGYYWSATKGFVFQYDPSGLDWEKAFLGIIDVADKKRKLDIADLFAKGKKPRKDIIVKEIEAGLMEYAVHRRFDGMVDGYDYFHVTDADFKPAEDNKNLIDELNRSKGQTHWVYAATIYNDTQLGLVINFSDYYIRYKQEATKDQIPGGMAEGKPDSDFDAEQLAAGVKVEMEHTTDPNKAREIAKDHLTEDADYYRKLAIMEKSSLEEMEELEDKPRKKRETHTETDTTPIISEKSPVMERKDIAEKIQSLKRQLKSDKEIKEATRMNNGYYAQISALNDNAMSFSKDEYDRKLAEINKMREPYQAIIRQQDQIKAEIKKLEKELLDIDIADKASDYDVSSAPNDTDPNPFESGDFVIAIPRPGNAKMADVILKGMVADKVLGVGGSQGIELIENEDLTKSSMTRRIWFENYYVILDAKRPSQRNKPEPKPTFEPAKEKPKSRDEIADEYWRNRPATDDWAAIPNSFKYAVPVKRVNYELNPTDPGIAKLFDPIVDPMLNEASKIMTLVNFSDEGAVASNAHKLAFIHGATDNPGAYCITKTCQKETDYKSGKVADANYPNVQKIIKTTSDNIYRINLLSLKTYCDTIDRIAILNEASDMAFLKFGNQAIGFKNRYMIEICTFMLSLGHEYAIFRINDPTSAMLITEDTPEAYNKTFNGVFEHDFCLLMPMRLNTDIKDGWWQGTYIGDYDYKRLYNIWYELDRDGVVTEMGNKFYKINTGLTKEAAYNSLPFQPEILPLLYKFQRKNKNNTIPILEYGLCENQYLRVTDLTTDIKAFVGESLPKGLYRILKDGLLWDWAHNQGNATNDFVVPLSHNHFRYELVLMDRGALAETFEPMPDFVADDELRPVMNGVHFQTSLSEKTLSMQASDAHKLISRTIGQSIIREDHETIISQPDWINQFLEVSKSIGDQITISTWKDEKAADPYKYTQFADYPNEELVISTHNIIGTYPKYASVFPSTTAINWILPADKIRALVSKVKPENKKGQSAIQFTTEGTSVVITSVQKDSDGNITSTKELGSVPVEIAESAKIDTENGLLLMPLFKFDELAFNQEFLMDCLSVFDKDFMFCWTSVDKAVIMMPVGGWQVGEAEMIPEPEAAPAVPKTIFHKGVDGKSYFAEFDQTQQVWVIKAEQYGVLEDASKAKFFTFEDANKGAKIMAKYADMKKPGEPDLIEKYADILTEENIKEQMAFLQERGEAYSQAEIEAYRERTKKSQIERFKQLNQWITDKDYIKLAEWLHTGNKTWRRFFTEVTGIELPKTEGGTKETLKNFTGYVPEQVVKMTAEERQAAMLKARNDSTLSKRINYGDPFGILTRKEFIEKAIEAGWRVQKVKVGKEKGQRGSEITVRDEQHEKELLNWGYTISDGYRIILDSTFYDITKAEYEYGVMLQNSLPQASTTETTPEPMKHTGSDGTQYWAEPNEIDNGKTWVVVSQYPGYDPTEAADDWFAKFEDADAIAKQLSEGKDIDEEPEDEVKNPYLKETTMYYKLQVLDISKFVNFLRGLKQFVTDAKVFSAGIGVEYLWVTGGYDKNAAIHPSIASWDFDDYISNSKDIEGFQRLSTKPQPEKNWKGQWVDYLERANKIEAILNEPEDEEPELPTEPEKPAEEPTIGKKITDAKGVSLTVFKIVDNVPIAIASKRGYSRGVVYSWLEYYDAEKNLWVDMGDPFMSANPSTKSIQEALEAIKRSPEPIPEPQPDLNRPHFTILWNEGRSVGKNVPVYSLDQFQEILLKIYEPGGGYNKVKLGFPEGEIRIDVGDCCMNPNTTHIRDYFITALPHLTFNEETMNFEEIETPPEVIEPLETAPEPEPEPEKAPETAPAIDLNITHYPDEYKLNRAIEQLLDSKPGDLSNWSIEEKGFLMGYTGYGGLDTLAKKYGEDLQVGTFSEFYTPDAIVQQMWALAYKHGWKNDATDDMESYVLEPSAGIGAFLKYAPDQKKITAIEMNPYSARILKILYPDATVLNQKFERVFIKNNESVKKRSPNINAAYSLVIGNPPYGNWEGIEKGMGEGSYTKAGNFVEYFIIRGLDLLKPGGLLIYIVGAEPATGGKTFLQSGLTEGKRMIAERADIIDAYRFPNEVFERTGVTSEIVVFRKK